MLHEVIHKFNFSREDGKMGFSWEVMHKKNVYSPWVNCVVQLVWRNNLPSIAKSERIFSKNTWECARVAHCPCSFFSLVAEIVPAMWTEARERGIFTLWLYTWSMEAI